MMGKVLGIGLVALVQYLVWLAAGFALLVLSGRGTNLSVGPLKLSIGSVDPWLLLAFALFFLVGFFSYAGLFAAGGSMVSRTEDAQQVTTPLTWILVLVFFFAIYAMSNPDKPLSVAMSMVPLLSPIVMFVRVALGHPPVWQVVLSLVLSLGAILALIWGAAKIFRAGVLMYGRRMKLSVLLKALR
jgi:ABC-2 type transport system permease protein